MTPLPTDPTTPCAILQSSVPDLPAFCAGLNATNPGPKADDGMDWEEYADELHGLRIDPVTGIAIQPVTGVMVYGAGEVWECFGCFDTGRIIESAGRASQDLSIRALILAFDSPGGYTTGVDDAHGALLALRAARPDLPVYAYVDGQCCSAAAWVAAGCQERHAARRSTVGGIGVYTVTTDSSAAYQNEGLARRLITDGKYKGLGSAGVAWTEDWYALVAELVATESLAIKSAIKAAAPLVTDDWMQGQGHRATTLRDSGQVGRGYFLQTVPRLTGEEGAATLEHFTAAVAASLRV